MTFFVDNRHEKLHEFTENLIVKKRFLVKKPAKLKSK